MTKPVVDLSKERRKRKAAVAKQAARGFLDPKADKDTGFVSEDEDEQDEKPKDSFDCRQSANTHFRLK